MSSLLFSFKFSKQHVLVQNFHHTYKGGESVSTFVDYQMAQLQISINQGGLAGLAIIWLTRSFYGVLFVQEEWSDIIIPLRPRLGVALQIQDNINWQYVAFLILSLL